MSSVVITWSETHLAAVRWITWSAMACCMAVAHSLASCLDNCNWRANCSVVLLIWRSLSSIFCSCTYKQWTGYLIGHNMIQTSIHSLHTYRLTDTRTGWHVQIDTLTDWHTYRLTQVQTDTHRLTHAQIDTHRLTHVQTNTSTDRHTNWLTHVQTDTQTDWQEYKLTHVQTDTQTDWHTNWLTQVQTDTQTDWHTHRPNDKETLQSGWWD